MFVFDPPIVRGGLPLEELDLRTVYAPGDATPEEIVLAVYRGRLRFVPAEPPTPGMFEFAEKTGAGFDMVYTGPEQLPGHRTIKCLVCERTSQSERPERPGEIVLCSEKCADELRAHPARYLR